jgi:hypothetical protein
MSDTRRNVVSTTVTREATDDMGRPGPFVLVSRRLDDGDISNNWYSVDEALFLAECLIRAARP